MKKIQEREIETLKGFPSKESLLKKVSQAH